MSFLAAGDSTLAYWTAVTAIVTAVGLVITIIVAVVTLWAQWLLARRTNRLDNVWRLMEYWDGDKMWLMRAQAAREIRRQRPASDMSDVLNFFDHVGYLLRRRWIDTESAWTMFFDWALPYWHAASCAVAEDRRDDPFAWEDYQYLVSELLKYEAKRRASRGMPPYVGPDDRRDLVHGELGLDPGRLWWRRWWPR